MNNTTSQFMIQDARISSQKEEILACKEALKSNGLTMILSSFATLTALLIMANCDKNEEIVVWGIIVLLNMGCLFFVVSRLINLNSHLDKLKQELEEDIREIKKQILEIKRRTL